MYLFLNFLSFYYFIFLRLKGILANFTIYSTIRLKILFQIYFKFQNLKLSAYNSLQAKLLFIWKYWSSSFVDFQNYFFNSKFWCFCVLLGWRFIVSKKLKSKTQPLLIFIRYSYWCWLKNYSFILQIGARNENIKFFQNELFSKKFILFPINNWYSNWCFDLRVDQIIPNCMSRILCWSL